jgi:hypothetical protein
MPDIVGEAVDQLVTIEAKNRGMPHKVLKPMYTAAREAAGGRPLSILCAEKLKAAVKPGDPVLILTGAGYEPTLPKGESDGPPGAAALARVLYRGLGAVPVYVCEGIHAEPVVASSEATGVMIKSLEVARDKRLGAALIESPRSQGEVSAWVGDVLDRVKPVALVSAERLGPGANGKVHNATGQPVEDPQLVDFSPIVPEAAARGIPTIGIGDHGNELGFGTIHDTVVKTMPKGETLATTVATDIVFPVMMSNWGCYAIEACLAFLCGRADLMHSAAQEERTLRACLDAGGLEAMWCTTDFLVDGLDGETSMAVCQFLRNIVRKNLESTTRGLAH